VSGLATEPIEAIERLELSSGIERGTLSFEPALVCDDLNVLNVWNGPVPVMNGARALSVAKRSRREAVERLEQSVGPE